MEQRGGLDPADPVRLTAVKLKINDGLENNLYFKSGGGKLLTAWCVTQEPCFYLCGMEQGVQTPVNILAKIRDCVGVGF